MSRIFRADANKNKRPSTVPMTAASKLTITITRKDRKNVVQYVCLLHKGSEWGQGGEYCDYLAHIEHLFKARPSTKSLLIDVRASLNDSGSTFTRQIHLS